MNRRILACWTALLLFTLGLARAEDLKASEKLFTEKVADILETNCVRCHNLKTFKGKLSLESYEEAIKGGDSGEVIVPGESGQSLLVEMISGDKPEMPSKGDPLTKEEVGLIKKWIDTGAGWPVGMKLKEKVKKTSAWWSLQPLAKVEPPKLNAEDEKWVRTPIDRFTLAMMREKGLTPAAEADARTLIRRIYFDLIGLPPTAEEVEAFVKEVGEEGQGPGAKGQGNNPQSAYERLVDRLLASPHYGERWARHWLDVVHYGDTHGYDKDKIRPNAWPYRDYVIRALSEDKTYARFVQEQLAGDVLFPGTTDGIVALGFIAAGPFDWVGQIELRENTLDKKITRNLDRDDMVRTAMETFVSSTVGCARCHNHKFDPIPQEDYYSLQAVFAAVDRADRPYETDPKAAVRRIALAAKQDTLQTRRRELEAKVAADAGPELVKIDARLKQLAAVKGTGEKPEFGYHSAIEANQANVKWVQIDLGKSQSIAHLIYVACHDTYNNIGAGFGFPVRYKIEVSNDAAFKEGVTVVVDHTRDDVANPGVTPQIASLKGAAARYLRITATKLAPRQNDYIFALGEVIVLNPRGENIATGSTITSLDSIEAPVRWRRTNLVDGYYYGIGKVDHAELATLQERRAAIIQANVDPATRQELADIEQAYKQATTELAGLPGKGMVYAAATEFAPVGSFQATRGKPRPVFLLNRGSEKEPLNEVQPGAMTCVQTLPARFEVSGDTPEGERRAALAQWITHKDNPLTWRSIVNRIWLYHFGRGIVDSPNDFGRMGQTPTHPALLDWLAMEFRDNGQSIKALHRMIVLSATYRQASGVNAANAKIDAGNQYLWRMNRSRLEAECIRDSVLKVAGKLDTALFGPGFKPFGFKDDHSPHYLYQDHDPDDAKSWRRSIYRFIVRSVPDPFMETLDCADPSIIVEKRNETLTALQALSLLNNRFMVRMSEHFAARVQEAAGKDADAIVKVKSAIRLAFGRDATKVELDTLAPLVVEHGLANVCRLIFNMNEFVFVD
ncbi:MAG: DUF1553 domain-containing protein [Phycisphaeraceae bacterium]